MSHLELVLESKARCMTAGCVLCELCCGYHTFIVVPKRFMLHFSMACSAHNAHTPPITLLLVILYTQPSTYVLTRGAMHPSRVAHTRPGSQTQKCSCRHHTSHTQYHVAHRPETFPTLGTRPMGETLVSLPTCTCNPPVERRGGRGRERKGRSHALAEEDGCERVVLADWRHVGRGLVCGVGELVVLQIIASARTVIVVDRLVFSKVGLAVNLSGGSGKATLRASAVLTPRRI